MNHTIDLPKTTLLTFRREDGNVVFSAEAVYLDGLLASAQAASRKSKANDDDHLWWLPAFTKLVNEKYQVDLSQTEAWIVARSTFVISDTVKKNIDLLARSLRSTESTRSTSTPTSSKDCTLTSPPSLPDENVKTEYEGSPSPPNDSTT